MNAHLTDPSKNSGSALIGDILKITFKLMRHSFLRLVGACLLPLLFVGASVFLMEATKANPVVLVLFMLVFFFSAVFVLGAFSLETFAFMNGETLTFGELVSRSFSKFWTCFVAMFKTGLVMTLGSLVMVLAGALCIALVGLSKIFLIIIIPAFIAGYVFLFRFNLQCMILFPIFLFENVRLVDGWERTKELTRGHLIVLFVVLLIFYMVFYMALLIPMVVIGFDPGQSAQAFASTAMVVTNVVMGIGGLLFSFFYFLLPTIAYCLFKEKVDGPTTESYVEIFE